jgi:hypothetical protein
MQSDCNDKDTVLQTFPGIWFIWQFFWLKFEIRLVEV